MGEIEIQKKVILRQTFKRFRRCLQANDCRKAEE